MIDLLAGFIQELRAAGLPVSLTENLDAMEAVKHIPIEDREAFKFALAATLVKNNAHWRSFETVFEVYFSLRGPQYKLKDDADADELWRDMQDQLRQGEGRAGAGGMDEPDARGARPAALPGADERRRGAAAGAGPPGRQPLRGHGAGPAGRRHVLPLPHPAEPRPRRAARPADGGHARAGRRRADAARGAAGAGRVPEPHRRVPQGDRGRDPAPAGGRPRRRGDGQDAAQAAARGRRLHARLARRDGVAAQGAVPADPQAGRPPGPQAPPRPQGPARLPQHGPPLALLRRRAGRAQVQVPPAGQAGADGRGRHLGLGRGLRPLHPAPRVRHPGPVLEGPLVRLHRRHRRGDRVLQGRRGHHRGRPPRQHRGRRRLGRRPLRLRPRLRGVLGALRQGRRARRPRSSCSATRGTTTTPPRAGS